MTNNSSPTPPNSDGKGKFTCNICTIDDQAYPGETCRQCSAYKKFHYATRNIGRVDDTVDYFCIGDAPILVGPFANVVTHVGWTTGIEKIIKETFIATKKLKQETLHLKGCYTYAAKCTLERPTKKVLKHCFNLLAQDLKCSTPDKPILIFAIGPAVLQTFGIKLQKYSSYHGQFIETSYQGRRILILASLSARQLGSKTGYYEILQHHIKIFLNTVVQISKEETVISAVKSPALNELTKNYVFPKTLSEVNELVNTIINHARPGGDPYVSPLSIDTETNTLNPHRQKLKLLTFIVSWDRGRAAAIPVEHSECTWTFKEIFPHIDRILRCNKPKVFHNAKFDLKVLWRKGFVVERFSWDTMLGEHLLSEDKRGYYGLKTLTRTWLPHYAGYESTIETLKTKAQKQHNKETTTKVSHLTGAARKWADDDGYTVIPLEPLNLYGALDADVTRQLSGGQRERITKDTKLLASRRASVRNLSGGKEIAQASITTPNPLVSFMYERSVPLTKVLARMELHGIAVDSNYLDTLAQEMDKSIVETKLKLHSMIPFSNLFPKGFNPSSPDQLRILFFSCGYTHPETKQSVSYDAQDPDLERTDKGVISTNARFLRKLITTHKCPFATELLQFRALTKARSTFVENIRILSQEDGRMHTSFHIHGTATGRLSSSDENMQNIPKRIGIHNLKKIFIPSSDDKILVNADAKAAEVRLYAAYSRDPNLIKALSDGMDPHSFFAATVYNPASVLHGIHEPEEQESILQTIGIDSEHTWTYDDFQNRDNFDKTDPNYGKQLNKLRTNIKRVVFGILYGASKRKISSIVGIPDIQAQAIIDVLFRMFPTIQKYIDLTKDQVQNIGIVETFFGRRRRFNLDGLTKYLTSKAERQAINFKIQSTSSDIVLGVLCDIDGPLRDIGGQLLITVHDSLVFEVPKKNLSQVPDLIETYGVKNVATQCPWLPVPFHWDIEVGSSYGELQPIQTYLQKQNLIPIIPDSVEEYIDHEIHQEFIEELTTEEP